MHLVVAVMMLLFTFSDAVMSTRSKFWQWNFQKPANTTPDGKSYQEIEDVPQFLPTGFHDFVSTDQGLSHSYDRDNNPRSNQRRGGYYPVPPQNRLPVNVYMYGPRRDDVSGRLASGSNPEPENRLPFLDSYEFFADVGNSVSSEKGSKDGRKAKRSSDDDRLDVNSTDRRHWHRGWNHTHGKSWRNNNGFGNQTSKEIGKEMSREKDGHTKRNLIEDGQHQRNVVEYGQHRQRTVENGQVRRHNVGKSSVQRHTIEDNRIRRHRIDNGRHLKHIANVSKNFLKSNTVKHLEEDGYSQNVSKGNRIRENRRELQKSKHSLKYNQGTDLNSPQRIRRSYDMAEPHWPWWEEDMTPNYKSTFLQDIAHQTTNLLKDPVPAFVATFLPLSLIVAAAMPLLAGSLKTPNGMPSVTTTATGDGKVLLAPILDEVGGFTPRVSESDCIQKVFCRAIRSDGDYADPLSLAMTQVAAYAKDSWLEAFNLKTLLEALENGNCDGIVCDESQVYFSNE